MSNDFRTETPVWFRYAENHGTNDANKSGFSAKYYEVRIDMDDDGWFVFTRRWGALPDRGVGQIKVGKFRTLQSAQGNANVTFNSKLARGYAECRRPEVRTG